jgi:hypothetical protein
MERLLTDETAEQVRAALAAVAPHYRDVLVLIELSEMSYAEAARDFGAGKRVMLRCGHVGKPDPSIFGRSGKNRCGAASRTRPAGTFRGPRRNRG